MMCGEISRISKSKNQRKAAGKVMELKSEEKKILINLWDFYNDHTLSK